MQVRPARPDDIPAVQAIYAHHVLTGLASFEEEAPSPEEMRRRYEEITAAGFPYVVAEFGGVVGGYGYCALYRTRSAYRYAVEDSVYVRQDMLGRGLGRRLLLELIRHCEASGSNQKGGSHIGRKRRNSTQPWDEAMIPESERLRVSPTLNSGCIAASP